MKAEIERLKKELPEHVEGSPIRFLSISGFSRADMPEVYQIIDILVRPSYWDGDPFMVHEAIHHGVRCITTFSSNPLAIKITPGNFGELKQKTLEAIDNIIWKQNYLSSSR